MGTAVLCRVREGFIYSCIRKEMVGQASGRLLWAFSVLVVLAATVTATPEYGMYRDAQLLWSIGIDMP